MKEKHKKGDNRFDSRLANAYTFVGIERTLNSFYVSGVKDQRGFTEPEHVEAGVAIATPDANKEQEHGPIVKTKMGTTHILRATIGTTQQRFLPG